MPVFIHTGDPAEFFETHDNENERWLEMATSRTVSLTTAPLSRPSMISWPSAIG